VKPAPFDYLRAASVAEAVAALAEFGDGSKVLAGGQSLLPMMNFRLARPEALVDIGGISELRGVAADDGFIEIGALTRHADLERSTLPGPVGTLLRSAGAQVGHLPIRTRGTFGGSLAHADPASEWCLLAVLLDATMAVTGPVRTRVIAAADFFTTVFTTALEPDELLTAARLPRLDRTWRVAVAEFARRAGDFAIVAAMVACRLSDGIIDDARVSLGGVADRPVRSGEAESLLAGRPAQDAVFRAAADAAAAAVTPPADIHGSAGYRRDLVRVLVRRALERMTP
jgi:carbon-monoxide dehydrogenase medium subunit